MLADWTHSLIPIVGGSYGGSAITKAAFCPGHHYLALYIEALSPHPTSLLLLYFFSPSNSFSYSSSAGFFHSAMGMCPIRIKMVLSQFFLLERNETKWRLKENVCIFFFFFFFFSFRSDADCHLLDINFIVLC